MTSDNREVIIGPEGKGTTRWPEFGIKLRRTKTVWCAQCKSYHPEGEHVG